MIRDRGHSRFARYGGAARYYIGAMDGSRVL